VAGFPTPAEAEAAVRKARAKPGEQYDVLEGAITDGRGPQPKAGEVTLLKGAV
jgi:hypothetical protein